MELKPFLTGSLFVMRPLELADIEGNYVNWLNDPEVCEHNSHHVFPYTPAQAKEYVERVHRDDHNLVLAIVDAGTNRHIGNISLQKIDTVSRNAEYAILIGEKEFWGKGISKEASQLLITHGFTTLNLHRIYCGTSSTNTAMQKLAASLGFTQEGVRKEAQFKNGAYVDIIEYGLLRDQWHV